MNRNPTYIAIEKRSLSVERERERVCAYAAAMRFTGELRETEVLLPSLLSCVRDYVIGQRIGSQDSSVREGGWKETETGAFPATLNRSILETFIEI